MQLCNGKPSSSFFRYPDDVHGRLGLPKSKTSTLVSATAPIEDLPASGSLSIDAIPSYRDPPLAVLKSATTSSGNVSLSLPTGTYIFSSYLALDLLELDPTANATDREFKFRVPDPWYDDSSENPFNFSGSAGGDYWIYNDMVYPTNASLVMYPVPSRTSLRGPIISSLELSCPFG